MPPRPSSLKIIHLPRRSPVMVEPLDFLQITGSCRDFPLFQLAGLPRWQFRSVCYNESREWIMDTVRFQTVIGDDGTIPAPSKLHLPPGKVEIIVLRQDSSSQDNGDRTAPGS